MKVLDSLFFTDDEFFNRNVQLWYISFNSEKLDNFKDFTAFGNAFFDVYFPMIKCESDIISKVKSIKSMVVAYNFSEKEFSYFISRFVSILANEYTQPRINFILEKELNVIKNFTDSVEQMKALDDLSFELNNSKLTLISPVLLEELEATDYNNRIESLRKMLLNRKKINQEDTFSLDVLFGTEPNDIEKPFKKQKPKKKQPLSEISQNSFFKKIRNGKLTKLEIHNKTEIITDYFKQDKLKILFDDFELYILIEKEEHENSYSALDVQTAIDELNKNNKEIPTNPIKDFQKGEDGKIKLIETGKKVLNKERLLYPFEFFFCYQYKNYLVDKINNFLKESPIINKNEQKVDPVDENQLNENAINCVTEENNIKPIIEDYLEQYLLKKNISQLDYDMALDLITLFVQEKEYSITKPLIVKGRIKKKFAYQCGNMFKELFPNSIINYGFLYLLTRLFSIFKDEEVEESNFQNSNLYRYLTTKTQ